MSLGMPEAASRHCEPEEEAWQSRLGQRPHSYEDVLVKEKAVASGDATLHRLATSKECEIYLTSFRVDIVAGIWYTLSVGQEEVYAASQKEHFRVRYDLGDCGRRTLAQLCLRR
jgi:hypothetical protein